MTYFEKLYDNLAEELSLQKLKEAIQRNPKLVRPEDIKYFSHIYAFLEREKLHRKRFLDLGCGWGKTMWLLEIEDYTGLDISKNALRIAKKLFKKPNFVQGSVEKMPFKKESFGVVVFTEVIEHLPEPEKAVSEIYRVMNSRGILFITTPNRYRWLHFPLARIIPWPLKIKLIELRNGKKYAKHYAKQKQIEDNHGIDQHQKLYSSKSLSELLKQTGFEIIETKTFGSTANQFSRAVGSIFEKIPWGRDSLLVIAKKP